MKKILVLIISLATLTGCSFSYSTEKEKETECVYEDGIKTTVITSISKGNEIISETYVTTDDFSDEDERKSILEGVEEQFEEYAEDYDVDGVEYDYEINRYKVTETIKVTYDELDINDGLDLGLIRGVDPDEKNFVVKLDESTDSREQQGFTCSE